MSHKDGNSIHTLQSSLSIYQDAEITTAMHAMRKIASED